jgi:dihydropteroate synthase
MNLEQKILDRTLIFGILNVTPDSFSDGGKFFTLEKAVAQAKQLINDGADVIDVGGESTRPGAERITSEEELSRVIPVVSELVKQNIVVSIDTMRSEVAKAAVATGAKYVNDVSGGKADQNMFMTISQLNAKYILMHWRGQSKNMDDLANYQDVVKEVIEELSTQIEKALAAGVKKENLIIDPGLGFAKKPEHNWTILQNLEKFNELKLPMLIGHSRKRFLNELANESNADIDFKDAATAAISYQLANKGVWAVRVHEAKQTYSAIAAAHRLRGDKL